MSDGKPETKADNVNHPSHYAAGKIEVIEAIEDWMAQLPPALIVVAFHLGNAIKYTARAGKKDPAKTTEDLEKAIWYLRRAIVKLKGEDTRPNDMDKRDAQFAERYMQAAGSAAGQKREEILAEACGALAGAAGMEFAYQCRICGYSFATNHPGRAVCDACRDRRGEWRFECSKGHGMTLGLYERSIPHCGTCVAAGLT